MLYKWDTIWINLLVSVPSLDMLPIPMVPPFCLVLYIFELSVAKYTPIE